MAMHSRSSEHDYSCFWSSACGLARRLTRTLRRVIFAIPLGNLLVPVTYLFLTGTGKSGRNETEIHWENES